MPKLPEDVSWPEGGFNPGNGVYLPMSYAETWEVSSSVKKRIELTRLVSRLQVKVANATSHELQLDGLTFGSFNNRTLLFGGAIKDWYEKSDVNFLPAETKTLQPMGNEPEEYTSDWMYVFETAQAKGFLLDFNTTSKGRTLFHAVDMHSGTRNTKNTEVKRNHIWNLNLWVCGYTLTLKLEGENPPIGGYPVITSNVMEGLSGTLYGGGPFTLEIGMLKSPENQLTVPNDIQWSIIDVENSDLLIDKQLELVGKTIKGCMVGYADNGKSLKFKLKATSNGQVVSVFPVTLKFEEIFNMK